MYFIVIFCFTWNNPKAFLFCVFCHKVPLYSKYFTLLFLWKAPLAVPANLIPICSHLQSEYKAPTIYINCTYSLKRDKQKISTVLYSIFDFFKNYRLWIIKALMSRTLFNSWSSCLSWNEASQYSWHHFANQNFWKCYGHQNSLYNTLHNSTASILKVGCLMDLSQ